MYNTLSGQSPYKKTWRHLLRVVTNTNAINTFHKNTFPSPSILGRSALMRSHHYSMLLVIHLQGVWTLPKPPTVIIFLSLHLGVRCMDDVTSTRQGLVGRHGDPTEEGIMVCPNVTGCLKICTLPYENFWRVWISLNSVSQKHGMGHGSII